MGRMRLDQWLEKAGRAQSRSRARDLIRRGFVTINGVVETKPARSVPDGADVDVSEEAPGYVSRGAEKLAAALDHFDFAPAGLAVLDAGASTGGFTELLLEHGAEKVFAVEKGSEQLHARVKSDPRVVSLENTDIRDIKRDVMGNPIEAVVADLSFISVTKALGPALELCMPQAWAVVLIKPQFEVGPDGIGKGGIVRDEARQIEAVDTVSRFVANLGGWTIEGVIPSPILGGSGNAEFLLGARKTAS
ncbi:MAG: TlyA family RNA methyltransferase [Pseudomonadota bacterium]